MEIKLHPPPPFNSSLGEGWRSPWASRLGSGIQGQWRLLLDICRKFHKTEVVTISTKAVATGYLFVGCLGQNLAPQEAVCLPLGKQCLRCTVIATVGRVIPTTATPQSAAMRTSWANPLVVCSPAYTPGWLSTGRAGEGCHLLTGLCPSLAQSQNTLAPSSHLRATRTIMFERQWFLVEVICK